MTRAAFEESDGEQDGINVKVTAMPYAQSHTQHGSYPTAWAASEPGKPLLFSNQKLLSKATNALYKSKSERLLWSSKKSNLLKKT